MLLLWGSGNVSAKGLSDILGMFWYWGSVVGDVGGVFSPIGRLLTGPNMFFVTFGWGGCGVNWVAVGMLWICSSRKNIW